LQLFKNLLEAGIVFCRWCLVAQIRQRKRLGVIAKVIASPLKITHLFQSYFSLLKKKIIKNEV